MKSPDRNTKSQGQNTKQLPKTKFQNGVVGQVRQTCGTERRPRLDPGQSITGARGAQVLGFGVWCFFGVWCLVFGVSSTACSPGVFEKPLDPGRA